MQQALTTAGLLNFSPSVSTSLENVMVGLSMRHGSLHTRFVHVSRLPATPLNDSEVALRSIRQHRKEFQQVAVRIVEKERSSGHPSKNHWLVGGLARKIEWDDVRVAKAIRSLQQVFKTGAECHLEVHSLRTHPRFPQPDHLISSRPYPVERDLS